MNIESTIYELHNQRLVCGETFLYCIENGIDTVQDLLCVEISGLSNQIVSDIQYVQEQLSLKVDTEIEDAPSKDGDTDCINYDVVFAYYKAILLDYDQRTRNVLDRLYNEYNELHHQEFINYLIHITKLDAYKIRNAGRKTVEQILELSGRLRDYIETSNNIPTYMTEHQQDGYDGSLNIDISTTLPESMEHVLIEPLLDSLSVRGRNAFNKVFKGMANGSVRKLYMILFAPTFDVLSIQGVGKKTITELKELFDVIRYLCERHISGGLDASTIDMHKVRKVWSDNGVPYSDDLYSLSVSLGHFPLLKAIQLYIDNMAERERIISTEYLHFYQHKPLADRGDLAIKLSISAERIRQLSVKIIKELSIFIKKCSSLLAEYHYPIFNNDATLLINESEGTQFNTNFLRWSVALTDSEVELLGNPEDAFKEYHGKFAQLYVIPKNLYDVYDFQALIKELDILNDRKVYDDFTVSYRSLLCKFFKDYVYFEYLDVLENICDQLIKSQYQCRKDGEELVFPANAERTAPEIVEMIIRANGAAMTLDQIYQEFYRLYPNKKQTANSLRAAIHQNKVIKPIGRSSTYTLAEWNQGQDRGGTIREFAYEYLIKHPAHIDTLSAVCEYIGQYREVSDEQIVSTNLLAETAHRFGLYSKDGIRYIGLISYVSDKSFELYDKDTEQYSHRDFKSSCTVLEQFIVEHQRYPFGSGDSNESRLYRFVNVARDKVKKGNLSQEEEKIFNQIEKNYFNYRVSREDAIWWRNCKFFIQTLSTSPNGLAALKSKQFEWFVSTIKDIDTLPEWKKICLRHQCVTDLVQEIYNIKTVEDA
ncbi:hypothetical protein IAG16_13155 [Bacteroides thetaiotaomicron]|uniref:hypothetical protein n=1 Tax=Bacteroides thetaiotaomicron TaxID=818 RepID=UPI0018CABF7D|nr:hypothetical protein [Bacteroides thetaiotaomicron]MBG9235581.1 hypothetical protein [Bacteroides thetaiotaomicron]MBG9240710.1 hypothetical protein [Bacteroides thetaiotaomicron]